MNSPHSAGNRPSRRDLIRMAGGGLLVTTSLSGCSFFSTDPTSTGKDNGGTKKGPNPKEAPALAEQVKSGKLPKLSDRIPKNPLVLQPNEGVGKYGGTWRLALLNKNDNSWLGRTMGGENLLRWDIPWEKETEPLPNIAESVTPSSDGKVFTIKLRDGMKWSNGDPFDADDLLFAFNDVMLDPDITPVTPDFILSDTTPATIKKVDQTTVEITFAKPNGLFIRRCAMGQALTTSPRKYMSQFHKKYNKDVDKLAKQEKQTDWIALFLAKADNWANPKKPTLNPWMTINALGDSGKLTAVRNPYFWKVDPDGSQLPYLDRLVYDIISDAQVILLKGQNGELDFTTRHITNLANKPVLASGREKGKYHFVDLRNTVMNDMILAFNLNDKDPVLRKIFQNKDFRVGMSYAINRPEMINAVWQRQGEPYQAAPVPESEFYDEEFAKQYTEYDVAKANDHLDKAGLTKKDGDGFRLRPDGKKLTFQIEVASPAFLPFWPDAANFVSQYWKKVGVDVSVKNEDRSLFYERKDANGAHCTVWQGDGGGRGGEILEPRWYFPYSNESNYAQLWRTYFQTRGKDGEKPPPETLKQMQLYWQLTDEPDAEKQKDLYKQILQISKEQFYAIGTVRIPKTFAIVKNNFHGVPKVIPEAPVYNTPYPIQPAQFWIG
jgi:peptide/nickel transport system substrate-binding protein